MKDDKNSKDQLKAGNMGGKNPQQPNQGHQSPQGQGGQPKQPQQNWQRPGNDNRGSSTGGGINKNKDPQDRSKF